MGVAHTDTYVVGDGAALPASACGKSFVLKQTVKPGVTGIAQNEVIKLWDIPANTFVSKLIVNVIDAEGADQKIDVGDYLASDDNAIVADGWADNVGGNSEAASIDVDSTHHATFGKLYLVDAWIGAKFLTGAWDNGEFEFICIGHDCR